MKRLDLVKIKSTVQGLQRQTIVTVSAVLVSLLISAGVIMLLDIDPVFAMRCLFQGAFGANNSLSELLVRMSPLLFTGLSYALANRCGLTNLGMEGQLYMGALLSTLVGMYGAGLPSAILLPLAILAGFVGGALWGGFAGFLKMRFQASEIITTVMLNTVSTKFIEYLVSGPLIEPPGYLDQTPLIADAAKLNRIFTAQNGLRAHWGILLGLGFVLLFYIFLWKTKKGYEIRLSGQNLNAARYIGVNTQSNILLIMLLSGGLAGLAGANEILGIQYRLMAGISPGYGFDGIAVALIGNNTPLGIVVGAFLFGTFRSGGSAMQMLAKVPTSIISVIQACVIISVVSSNIILDRWNLRSLNKRIQQ